MIISTHSNAEDLDFRQLIETTSAGIALGLEGAGVGRLVSSCVHGVYLTTDQARVDAILPGAKARNVPKNIQEYRWTLEFVQKNLPRWIERCEDLTKDAAE